MTAQTPDALRVACPNCGSPAGKPCTAPTNTSRREVKWVHSSREHALTAPIERAAETIAESFTDQNVTLACSHCDWEATGDRPDSVRSLLEHCAHGHHVGRADVVMVRTSVFMTGNEVGLTLGSPALTEAEEKWRQERAATLT